MQAKPFIRTAGAAFSTVTVTSAEVISNMLPGKPYQFTTNIACWVKQGPTGSTTAVAGAANNVLCLPVQTYFFHGSNGNALAVVRDAADGKASACLMDEI